MEAARPPVPAEPVVRRHSPGTGLRGDHRTRDDPLHVGAGRVTGQARRDQRDVTQNKHSLLCDQLRLFFSFFLSFPEYIKILKHYENKQIWSFVICVSYSRHRNVNGKTVSVVKNVSLL